MKDIINNLTLQLKDSKTSQAIDEVRIKYLGKKGTITLLAKDIANQPPEQKAKYGKEVNSIRQEAMLLIQQSLESITNKEILNKMSSDKTDIHVPSMKVVKGVQHPLTIMTSKVEQILKPLGFSIQSGPEIVSDEKNFEQLNIPKDHPARDMQDTFYIDPNTLLRTHTSSVQIMTMENDKTFPIKILSPGKVYRRDDDDATHSHQFMQIEGLCVDENITMADLKATLSHLIKNLFGEKTEIRFRPSYFPFTEPSVEVDLTCFACKQKGCSICGRTGWIEILGAGMVHPKVLESCGIDSTKYQGYAFGIGIERIAMLSYNVKDIRDFYKNNLKFIDQFRKEF